MVNVFIVEVLESHSCELGVPHQNSGSVLFLYAACSETHDSSSSSCSIVSAFCLALNDRQLLEEDFTMELVIMPFQTLTVIHGITGIELCDKCQILYCPYVCVKCLWKELLNNCCKTVVYIVVVLPSYCFVRPLELTECWPECTAYFFHQIFPKKLNACHVCMLNSVCYFTKMLLLKMPYLI